MLVHILAEYCSKGSVLFLGMCLPYIKEITRNHMQLLVVIKCCMPCLTEHHNTSLMISLDVNIDQK